MTQTHFENLPLGALRVWPGNPRRTVDPTKLEELGESIREKGVRVPLLVRAVESPVPGDCTHEILAGQRRFLAARSVLEAGATVPCVVHAVDDAEALELSLLENAARDNPDPIEEAEAIERLLGLDRTVQQVADRLGHHFTWIEKRRKLLGLTEVARAWVRARGVPLAHAQALATVPADVQAQICSTFAQGEIPGSRTFLSRVCDYLHQLDRAPFDATDAKLPGGACTKCPKRSDHQLDLFDASGEGVSCLDPTCWGSKIAATWDAAQKSAKKRKLTVLADPREVFSWEDQTKHDVPYTSTRFVPEGSGLKPVAIARTDTGQVVELYDRAAVTEAREKIAAASRARDLEDDEDESEGDAGDGAPREKSVPEWKRKRQEHDARVTVQLARIAKGLSNPSRFDDVARMLMMDQPARDSVPFEDTARAAMGLGADDPVPVGRAIEALLLSLIAQGLGFENPREDETEAWVRSLAGEQPLAPPYAPSGPRELSLKRGDWLQHRKGLLDAKGLALHKKWSTSPQTEARTIVLEQGAILDQVLAYAAEHELKLGVQLVGADDVDESDEAADG